MAPLDGGKLYVANGRSNPVSVLDTRLDKVLKEIRLGTPLGPGDPLSSPAGSAFPVAYRYRSVALD